MGEYALDVGTRICDDSLMGLEDDIRQSLNQSIDAARLRSQSRVGVSRADAELDALGEILQGHVRAIIRLASEIDKVRASGVIRNDER